MGLKAAYGPPSIVFVRIASSLEEGLTFCSYLFVRLEGRCDERSLCEGEFEKACPASRGIVVLVAASTAGGASKSGTLVFAGASDPTYLDPALVSDGESFRVTEQMFEGLVKLRPGTTKIVPSLATSWKLTGGQGLDVQPAQGREVP